MTKTFASPVRDPDFAKNHLHGVMRQRECFNQAMLYVKNPGESTAIDVGAHIGIWTDAMAGKFKRVVAFEPTGDNFLCLARNTHELKNVELYRGALGGPCTLENQQHVRMALPTKGNSGMWRVHVELYGGDAREIDQEAVPFAPLDAFGIKSVGLLKIDVEGFEGFVIDGARTTLTESRPVVVFEDNGLGPRYYRHTWIDPKVLLKALGYKKRFRWQKDEIWIPC
jgi:FkbM family methyltransferase